jgi:hypothetical protein
LIVYKIKLLFRKKGLSRISIRILIQLIIMDRIIS